MKGDFVIQMNKPIKVTKCPVEVEAMQFVDVHNGLSVCDWVKGHGGNIGQFIDPGGDHFLVVHTLEGKLYANLTDWIIREVNGEFYPCKDEIFKKTYTGWGPKEEQNGA